MKAKKRLTMLAAAIGGMSILAAAGAWTASSPGSGPRPPAPVKARRTPQPNKPPTLSVADAEHLFRGVLLRRQAESLSPRGRCGVRDSWLVEDLRTDSPIARLFARAYPEMSQRLTLEILEDPEAPKVDRWFALLVVEALPDWTSDRLEELLREMVEKADDCYATDRPLAALGHRDRDMRHRDLYQRQCRQGEWAAFKILSREVHSTSVALFQELAKESPARNYPLGSIPEEAEQSLKRLQLLQARDWKEVVQAFITKPTVEREDYGNFFWACEVAKRRNLPNYLDCLARRARTLPAPNALYAIELKDHALVMFAEEGGELTPAEFDRLRENGFVGEPEERLLQLLKERRLR